MEDIKYNHDTDNFLEAVGITKEESDSADKLCTAMMKRYLKESLKVSQVFELLVKSEVPLKMIYTMATMFMINELEARQRSSQEIKPGIEFSEDDLPPEVREAFKSMVKGMKTGEMRTVKLSDHTKKPNKGGDKPKLNT